MAGRRFGRVVAVKRRGREHALVGTGCALVMSAEQAIAVTRTSSLCGGPEVVGLRGIGGSVHGGTQLVGRMNRVAGHGVEVRRQHHGERRNLTQMYSISTQVGVSPHMDTLQHKAMPLNITHAQT